MKNVKNVGIVLGVMASSALQAQTISGTNLDMAEVETKVDELGGGLIGILEIVFLIMAAIGLLIVAVKFFSQKQNSKEGLGMFGVGLALYFLFQVLF